MGSIKKKYSRKNNRSNRPRVRRKSMKRKSMKRKSMKRKYKNTRKVRRKRLTGGDGGETFDDKGPLPEGWKTKIVDKRGDVDFEPRRAYYNRETGQKQWLRPTETTEPGPEDQLQGGPVERMDKDTSQEQAQERERRSVFFRQTLSTDPLGLTDSQVKSIIQSIQGGGPLLEKNFDNLKQNVLDLISQLYNDLFPTLASMRQEGDDVDPGDKSIFLEKGLYSTSDQQTKNTLQLLKDEVSSPAVPDVDPEVFSYDPKPEIFKRAVGEAGFYADGDNIKDEKGFLPKGWTTIGSGQGRGRIWYDPHGKQHFTRPEASSGVSREVTSEGSAVSPEVADVAQGGDAFKETLLKSITEQLKNRITSFPCGTGDCTQDFVKEALDDSDEMLNNALVETIKNI